MQSSSRHAHEGTAPAIQSKTAATALHRSRTEGTEPSIPGFHAQTSKRKLTAPNQPHLALHSSTNLHRNADPQSRTNPSTKQTQHHSAKTAKITSKMNTTANTPRTT
ncbi:hypothetical protein VNO80_01710 [Phaseolus coccineus]|uniref:Uncharacterized protein n=1 Tax=Phaseolus coccineus TaxID=3886 RepID=A0AAN9WXA8_PHACN